MSKMKIVYIGMSVDLIHHEYLNIIGNNKKSWVTIIMVSTASGKSTLGSLLYEKIQSESDNIKFYDGDTNRKKLKNEYSHSLLERFKILAEYLEIISEDCEQGYYIIHSSSKKNKMREIVKNKFDNVFLNYLHCDANEKE